jgi:acetate kinase
VKVFVVPTNEQVGIAKDTYELAAQAHPVASARNP